MSTATELNGRLADTASGGPRSMDGFVPVRRQHHLQPHAVQHSQTLMRQSVRQPADGFKRHAHTVANTGALVRQPQFDVAPKHSAQAVDRARLERSGMVTRSDYVRRFAAPVSARTSLTATPQPARAPQPSPAASTPARQPSSDVFERALAAANSHKQPYVAAKHHGKRGHGLRIVTGIAASLAAVALIVGFVVYQNMSLIQLRLASAHAGINATMPIWQPSGFRLGTLNYSHGNVAMTYTNQAVGQSYTVSESPTKWTADDLLNTYVYPNNETYNTLSSGSTTIYTYGTNNATWVSSGIWYKLVSNGSLSNSQIVNIATSMRS